MEFIVFTLLGFGSGALIAGIAVGLVLTYRGSGIINLAMGAVAMVSAYAFWALTSGDVGPALSQPLGFVLAVAISLAVGLAMELLAFRPLRTAPPLAKLVASLGVLLIAQAAIILAFGYGPKAEPSILPTDPLEVGGYGVPVSNVILAGIVIAAAICLAAVYRWSRFGLETRAAFENEAAARWTGLSPDRLAMVNTLLGAGVVGVLGVLVAPVTSADTSLLPLQVVPALAAALFANFTSIGIACGAGLAIGAAQNLLYYASTLSWFPTANGIALPGVQPLLVFILIVIALYLRGSTLPTRGDYVETALPPVPRPKRILRPGLLAALVVAVCLIVFPFDYRYALINSITATMLILSLVIITGFVGQISVVQLALSGVSAFVVAHAANDLGIGFPADAILGICAAVALGLVIGVSALRVRGVLLAVATLAAAVAIERFWFANAVIGEGGSFLIAPQPSIFGVELGLAAPFRGLDGEMPSPILGFVLLAVATVVCFFVANLRRTRLGQSMVVVRSNERAAAAVGLNVSGIKVAAFAISSFIAGVAGVLSTYNFVTVSAVRFSALAALGLIAFAYIGGITMVSGAIIAGALTVEALVPHVWEKWFGLSGTWALLLAGVLLIVVLVACPDGISGAAHRWRRTRRAGIWPTDPAAPAPTE